MEPRCAVLAQGEKPKIYKVPVNKMARLINEFPFQNVEIFETLNDAKVSSSSPPAFIPPQGNSDFLERRDPCWDPDGEPRGRADFFS